MVDIENVSRGMEEKRARSRRGERGQDGEAYARGRGQGTRGEGRGGLLGEGRRVKQRTVE